MITKTLRASGGDFTTLTQVTTYLHTQLSGTGPSDDIDIVVQGGSSFTGSITITTIPGGQATLNSRTLRIYTDLVERVTLGPATLTSFNSSFGVVGGAGGTGILEIEGLKFQGGNGMLSFGLNPMCTIARYKNNIILNNGAGGGYITLLPDGLSYNNLTIEFLNNNIYFNGINSWTNAYIFRNNVLNSKLVNNFIGMWNGYPGTSTFNMTNGTTKYNDSNVLYDYSGDSITIVGTHTNSTVANPTLTTQPIQSDTDSATNILGRSPAFASSIPLRGLANNTYKTTIDIFGTTRA